jgi:hypothetical protein
MSDGFLHNYTVSGTTDGEEFQELATGAFKEDESPQYVFWEQGDYTQLKIEVDDLWSSSDNAAHIAELMLVVPPDSKRYKAVKMDGLVAGGLPDADYPLLPIERDSSDSKKGKKSSIARSLAEYHGQDAGQTPAKVFVRNHEVLIRRNGKIYRMNGGR